MGFLNWLGWAKAGKSLEIGDPAPGILAQDEAGNEVSLAEYCKESFTLIYFFPKADTPGCTAQACALRDEFTELAARRIRVIGVSADSPETLRKFKVKNPLPFPLLTDQKQTLSQAFGVPTLLGMTYRQSFLIRDGVLVWRDLRASAKWQARDVLEAVKGLLLER